ncbi:MAG: hypothetical protein PW734_12445 [Verrucomicrobium sp.]|nr:hypothetical protein [Verrucomicrobium sp.]
MILAIHTPEERLATRYIRENLLDAAVARTLAAQKGAVPLHEPLPNLVLTFSRLEEAGRLDRPLADKVVALALAAGPQAGQALGSLRNSFSRYEYCGATEPKMLNHLLDAAIASKTAAPKVFRAFAEALPDLLAPDGKADPKAAHAFLNRQTPLPDTPFTQWCYRKGLELGAAVRSARASVEVSRGSGIDHIS